MEKRSLAAIDSDLVLVQHELSLAEPHRQECPDTYAALTERRQELEQEREEAENPGRISRLPVAYRRESPDAGALPFTGEGTKSDAQPIRISGHGGRVVPTRLPAATTKSTSLVLAIRSSRSAATE